MHALSDAGATMFVEAGPGEKEEPFVQVCREVIGEALVGSAGAARIHERVQFRGESLVGSLSRRVGHAVALPGPQRRASRRAATAWFNLS